MNKSDIAPDAEKYVWVGNSQVDIPISSISNHRRAALFASGAGDQPDIIEIDVMGASSWAFSTERYLSA